jgi:16S rRNA G966 N2-methylase RsmD
MEMNEATRNFVRQHADDDVRKLALRGSTDGVDLTVALQQIQGRQAARKKLPSWASQEDILYPPHLNMEQCSSEQTARYKAGICAHQPASTTLVDLTGGFGVDFAFMSEAFDEATYVERNSELFAISSANMKILAPKAKCLNEDGLEVLHRLDHVSMIFMDPARRDHHGARTYGISDCTPNVLEIKDKLLQKADIVMLKLSPMLDWHKAISDLGEQYIKEVHIVSVQNECKELLIVMQQQPAEPLTVYCVNDDSVF